MKYVIIVPAVVLAVFLSGTEVQAAVAENFYTMPDPGVITHPQRTVQTGLAEEICRTTGRK